MNLAEVLQHTRLPSLKQVSRAGESVMKFDRRFPVPGLPLLAALSLALLASACGGGGGGNGDDTPAADTTAPTVTLTALPATVNRTVDVEATASDAVGVTEVQFYVDGASIGTD